ncbi:hypothetical protein HG530_012759 [Fusarium avenaceum]|nr:hypothetical protein HG530_012759 [Fusarium avenaceum]
MSSMDLYDIESSLHSSYGRILPFLHKALDLFSGQLMWCSKVVSKRDGTGRNNIIRPASHFLSGKCLIDGTTNPRRNCARFSASLYYFFGVLAMNEIRDALQRHNLAVLPEPGVLWTDTATRLDGCRLNKDKTSTLKGKLAEVNKMEICQVTIFGRSKDNVGEVLKEGVVILGILLNPGLELLVLDKSNVTWEHHEGLGRLVLVLGRAVPLLPLPLLFDEKTEVVVGQDGWREGPGAVEAGSIGVAATEGMGTG